MKGRMVHEQDEIPFHPYGEGKGKLSISVSRAGLNKLLSMTEVKASRVHSL